MALEYIFTMLEVAVEAAVLVMLLRAVKQKPKARDDRSIPVLIAAGLFAVVFALSSYAVLKNGPRFELFCLFVFAIGASAVFVSRNLIKMFVGILVMEYSTTLLLIYFHNPLSFAAPFLGIATAIVFYIIIIGVNKNYGTVAPAAIRELKE